MFGLIDYHATPYRVIDGVRFRCVRVAEGRGPRARLSAQFAALTLRREGVRFALFPPDYPLVPLFVRRGVEPPPLAPLYQAAAPNVVRRYLSRRGVDPKDAMVAFAAARAVPELVRCVTALCGEIRYIALCVPDGGEDFALALRREFGVAARVGAADALPRPDLTVVFDDTRVPDHALYLDERLTVAFDDPRPNALLALLHRAGALDAASLGVVTVKP